MFSLRPNTILTKLEKSTQFKRRSINIHQTEAQKIYSTDLIQSGEKTVDLEHIKWKSPRTKPTKTSQWSALNITCKSSSFPYVRQEILYIICNV